MSAKCPSCSAPMMHYLNSNGSSTDYCEYCNYRYDYPAPVKSVSSQLAGMAGKFIGNAFGVKVTEEPKLSPIEIMDREKERSEMLSHMSDKERRSFEKREASTRKQKIFDPVTGTYR